MWLLRVARWFLTESSSLGPFFHEHLWDLLAVLKRPETLDVSVGFELFNSFTPSLQHKLKMIDYISGGC